MPAWRTSATCGMPGERRGQRGHARGGRAVARQHRRFRRCAATPAPRRRPAGCRCSCANAGRRARANRRGRRRRCACGRQHRGQRQEAAGQALGQAQQVGRTRCRPVRRRTAAGAAEADRDLVGDQENAVAVAQFARAAQVQRVVHAHAAGALHQRFQDQRADLALGMRSSSVASASAARSAHCSAFPRRLRARRPARARTGPRSAAARRRAGTAACRRPPARPGSRRGSRSPARRTSCAPPRRGCGTSGSHLQRHLDPGRAVVGVEHLGQWCAPRLARRDRRSFSASSTAGACEKPARITCSSCAPARRSPRRCAVRHGRTGWSTSSTDRIEVAAAVLPDQPGAFAARDRHQRQQHVGVLAHLRARVPEHGEVAHASSTARTRRARRARGRTSSRWSPGSTCTGSTTSSTRAPTRVCRPWCRSRAVRPEAPNWRPGGYIDRLPQDPWKRDYLYLNPGRRGEIDVYTLGADGQPGGEGPNADIGSWGD
jgi:type II secretory pathway pseudopilin PulG